MEHAYRPEAGFGSQDSENDPVRSPLYGRFPKVPIIYSAIIAYCLIHLLIRVVTSPVLTLDEANAALLGQSFQLGYGSDQPPLLSWLFTLLDLSVGINLLSIAISKYALMGLGLSAFYKSALTVFEWMDEEGLLHRRLDLAAGATGALALIFMIGWANHEDQLPQTLDFALLSLTLLCMTKALTNKGYFWWAMFGLATGLSALSHLHLILFPLCLISAAMGMKSLTNPHYDANGDRLSPPAITWIRVGIAFAVALAIFTPHGMWMLQDGGPASALTLDDFGFGADISLSTLDGAKNFLQHRATSLQTAAISAIEYILPLGIVFMMLFWPMWFAYIYPFFPKRLTDEGPFERTWRRLFSYTLRLSIIFVCIIAIVTGHSLETAWMLPVFIAFPIWLFFQIQRSGPYFISMRSFMVIVVISIITVIAGRFVDWSEDIMGCTETRCRAYQPMNDFAESLELEGFANGTIVGSETHLTGNLRTQFPKARIIDAKYPIEAFPLATGKGVCIAVWRDKASMPIELLNYLQNDLQIENVNPAPEGAVRKSLINSRTKHSNLYYRFVKPNNKCK